MAGNKSGQALLESLLAVCILFLFFAAVLQVSLVLGAHEIAHHAASRSARARMVGFNDWMVLKCARVALIPNAGRMIVPDPPPPDPALPAALGTLGPGNFWSWSLSAAPAMAHADLELARIPEYLYSENGMRAAHILDYEDWDSIDASVSEPAAPFGGVQSSVRAIVRQDYRLWVPLHRAFYADDAVPLRAEAEMENHYPYYMYNTGP